MKYGHLERINCTLRTLSALFIGSGEELNKRDYIVNEKDGKVSIIDMERLIPLLAQSGSLVAYEDFLLQKEVMDLGGFLKRRGIDVSKHGLVLYKIDAGDALIKNPAKVNMCVKQGFQPYVPGSSIKGAIRTAIFAKRIFKQDLPNLKGRLIAEAESTNDEKKLNQAFESECSTLESKVFSRLECSEEKNNAVNDFMRAIQISDSRLLSLDCLTICGSHDISIKKPSNPGVPIFRECIKPGTSVDFTITLDLQMIEKSNMSLAYISDSLKLFARQHYENFEDAFNTVFYSETPTLGAPQLILGGGTGFVSKTITYQVMGNKAAGMGLVAKILAKQFVDHNHLSDVSLGASPHMLKATKYKSKRYQMGRCELIIKGD